MTAKRRPSLTADQLAFTFDAPRRPLLEAELAGFDRTIAAGVGCALKDDPRSRYEVAGAMSALLDEDVSKAMLDAYASEARDDHNISAARFFALIAVTERFDILDAVSSRVGARVLVGDEVNAARLGHLRSQMRELKRELDEAERKAKPISRERGRR